MEILKYSDLPQGGFAGLLERQFVTDQRVFGIRAGRRAVDGIGNFVYLADANFLPNGETGMHPHKEVDVISVMVKGRIKHKGSLEDGKELEAGMIQVQRAGGKGFLHNEINPDDSPNQMIQLWVLPDEPGEPAGYQVYTLKDGERLHVYGGSKDQNERFYSGTSIEVANVTKDQSVSQKGDVLAFLSSGSGIINGETIPARTLIRTNGLTFQAAEDAQLILVYTTNPIG